MAGLYALTPVCQLLTNKFKAGAATAWAGHSGESTNILLTMCPGGSRSRVGTLVNTDGIKLELQTNHQPRKVFTIAEKAATMAFSWLKV